MLVRAYGDEPFVHVLARGSQPRTAATSVERRHLQVVIDADSGRIIVTCAIDNLGKGAAARPSRTRTSCWACPRRPGSRRTEFPLSVTAARGFRAAGVAAGIKQAAADLALVINDGRPTPRRSLHQQPGQGRARALVAAGDRHAPGEGRLPELGRRQRLHRPRRIRRHSSHCRDVAAVLGSAPAT